MNGPKRSGSTSAGDDHEIAWRNLRQEPVLIAERRGALLPEPPEEAEQRLDASVLSDPQQPLPRGIDLIHEREKVRAILRRRRDPVAADALVSKDLIALLPGDPWKRDDRLRTVFPEAVCERLVNVGVSAADIADERVRMSEIAFGGTRNRSLLGTLNDDAFIAQSVDARRTEPESPEELMQFLSQTPILPLDGASPIELTRAAFGTQTVL